MKRKRDTPAQPTTGSRPFPPNALQYHEAMNIQEHNAKATVVYNALQSDKKNIRMHAYKKGSMQQPCVSTIPHAAAAMCYGILTFRPPSPIPYPLSRRKYARVQSFCSPRCVERSVEHGARRPDHCRGRTTLVSGPITIIQPISVSQRQRLAQCIRKCIRIA